MSQEDKEEPTWSQIFPAHANQRGNQGSIFISEQVLNLVFSHAPNNVGQNVVPPEVAQDHDDDLTFVDILLDKGNDAIFNVAMGFVAIVSSGAQFFKDDVWRGPAVWISILLSILCFFIANVWKKGKLYWWMASMWTAFLLGLITYAVSSFRAKSGNASGIVVALFAMIMMNLKSTRRIA